jgi:hypothetical protein
MKAARRTALLLYGLMWLCSCATAPKPAPPPVPAPAATVNYGPDIAVLRQVLGAEVPGALNTNAGDASWIAYTQAEFAASPYRITSPQLVVAVDRNPAVQQLRIIFAQPDGPWQVIGGGEVSTGKAGRHGYFITPTGVFPHSDAILDYHALGTYNENHIRGLGIKGMRVWDFGWQPAQEGWRSDGEMGDIRLLMHATDPDVLEPRLGHPDSKGCVRVSAAMNVFLDRHAVLDADYLHDAPDDPAAAAVLAVDGEPSAFAGRYMVVFDSSLAVPAPPARKAAAP